jgi:saccharopine dehydrogenase-like NADP-dependent oxidoreductase
VLRFKRSAQIKNLVKDFDVVVGALPGDMGFEAMKQVILSKKGYC